MQTGCTKTRAHIALIRPGCYLQVPDVLYAGAFLDAAQHDKLLKAVPAAFSVISADHLTLRYRPSNQWLQSLPLGAQLELTISFVALQDGLQVGSAPASAFISPDCASAL